jgi:hypothetical protein
VEKETEHFDATKALRPEIRNGGSRIRMCLTAASSGELLMPPVKEVIYGFCTVG